MKKHILPITIYAIAKNIFFPPKELAVDKANDFLPSNEATSNTFIISN